MSDFFEGKGDLTRASLASLLNTVQLGRELHLHEQLGSTNDEAHRLAEAGAPHGTLVIAERQTAGRGRRGRTWIAPAGKSLALTLILRPRLPAARAPELAFAGALAVCETARALGVERAQVKWPNDVQVAGKKLSGLLAELRTRGSELSHVVLGIGVNVNTALDELPEELRPLATSLAIERGGELSRAKVCAELLGWLEHWLDAHATEGFEPLRLRWKELAATLGKQVRVESGPRAPGAAPERTLEGIAEDLDRDGALLVRTASGELRRVHAGDVEHLR